VENVLLTVHAYVVRWAGFTEAQAADYSSGRPVGAVRAGKLNGKQIGNKGIIHEKCRLPGGVAVVAEKCGGWEDERR
jgi:hypothetical protein